MHQKISSPVTYAILSLAVAANVLGGFYWIQRNVVLVGHDASGYLGTSLEYYKFFDSLSLQTLFQAFTYHDYRPTALFIAVQPFFRVFGANMDTAQYINILSLGVVIVLTYVLGRLIAGSPVGLFAALMVGFLPMMTAMSRLFYSEMLLTVAVMFNLLALYKNRSFLSRRWAVAWGVSLGVGLLVKWTAPIYLGLPALWLLWKSGVIHAQFHALRYFRVDLKRLLLASMAGLGISLIWFWPNRALAQTFPLGDALLIGWVLLLTPMFYAWMSPSSKLSNWWLGALLGVAIASLWYLPHIDFVSRLLQEDQARGQAARGLFTAASHLSYFRYIYDFHFGALAFWLIIPAALWPWAQALWRRRSLNPEADLLWLSLASTYLVLVIIAQRNPRNLVPLLPLVAILAVIALWSYNRTLRIALGVAWMTVLIVQWGVFTFDGLSGVYNITVRLWVAEDYSAQPASNKTDPGYWIGPDVLEAIAAYAPRGQRIGMLVNTHQIHRGALRYLNDALGYDVEIVPLTKAESQGWYDLLSTQWVLVKDGDNRNVEEPGYSLISRVLGDDPLFQLLYKKVAEYPLPDGDTVYLYHRTQEPGRPKDLPLRLEQTRAVADAIERAWSDNAHLIYATPELAIWVGIHDPVRERITVIGPDERTVGERLSPIFGTLLVVLDYEAEEVQAWLDQNAYRTYETGDDFASVAIYGRPQKSLHDISVEAGWPDVDIVGLRSFETISPGEVLPVETALEGAMSVDSKISVRVLDESGTAIATHDRPLTSADRFGLFIPPDTQPGTYNVVAVRYDPSSGEIMLTGTGAESAFLMNVVVIP